MAHLLKVDIYTFTAGRWLRYSCEDVEPTSQSKAAAIYLNHKRQNHYNVVGGVFKENMDRSDCLTSKIEENLTFSTENKSNQNGELKKKTKKI